MLLRFFQTQQPAAPVALFIFALAWWSIALFGDPQPLPVEGALLYKWLMGFLGAWPKSLMVFSALASVLLALYWNIIVEKHRLISRRNYLPAAMFLLLVSSNTKLASSLPILLASFFIIPAMDQIFRFSRQASAQSSAFDTGMFLAAATMFFTPSLIFLPLVFLALSNLRSFIWREWVMVLLGFFIPYLFAGVWLYWRDNTTMLAEHLQLFQNFHYPDWSIPSASFIGYLALFLWVLFAGWGPYGQSISTNTVRVKRSLILLLWLNFLLLFSLLSFGKEPIAIFGIVAFPFSIYLANYFTFTKNRWLGELLLFLLLTVNTLYQLEFHM